jgi:hypothetical protein
MKVAVMRRERSANNRDILERKAGGGKLGTKGPLRLLHSS